MTNFVNNISLILVSLSSCRITYHSNLLKGYFLSFSISERQNPIFFN